MLSKYSKDELRAAIDNPDDFNDSFLDALFGDASRLEAEVFIKKVSGEDYKYLFSADLFRQKLVTSTKHEGENLTWKF